MRLCGVREEKGKRGAIILRRNEIHHAASSYLGSSKRSPLSYAQDIKKLANLHLTFKTLYGHMTAKCYRLAADFAVMHRERDFASGSPEYEIPPQQNRAGLYFLVMISQPSINACRVASLLNVGRAACIPPPEQFVALISGGASPPQLIRVALNATTRTIYLEFIKLFLFKIH